MSSDNHSQRLFRGLDCKINGRALPPDQRVVKVLSASKSLNKLCGVWILFRSVEDAKIEACSESIPTGIPQTGVWYVILSYILCSVCAAVSFKHFDFELT